MAIQARGKAVHASNLGLYLDRPAILVPERGLSDGQNFRVLNGTYTNRNVGWQAFESLNLDNKPVLLIEEFQPIGGVRNLILANTTDIFKFFNDTLTYITPRHDETGETIDVTNGSATVTGNSTDWVTDGIKAGDFLSLGADRLTPSPSATWYKVLTVNSGTQITLTANYAEGNASTQAYTIRKVFVATIFTPYVTEIFRYATATVGNDGDRWYATNGVDGVIAWDGVTDQVYLPTLGSIQVCKALRQYKNTMIYLSPTIGGDLLVGTISSSAIGQPENLTTLEAAQFIVHDGGESIVNARQIGELLAIYTSKQIIMAQSVGTPLFFVFRAAIIGRGPQSSRGIVSFPSEHIFFGSDGQYTFDGVSARQISSHIWKEVVRRSSPNRLALVQAIVDEGNAELIWIMPLNTDADTTDGPPEKAYVGHYLEDVGELPMAHSFRELPATAVGQFIRTDVLTFDEVSEQFDQLSIRWDDQALQEAFPLILFGTNDGDIFQLNAQDQDGTVPTSFVRYSRRPLVDSRRNGVVKRVYPGVDFKSGSTSEMTVKIRLFDSVNGDVESTDESNITLDGSSRFVAFRASGRFVEVEFGSGPIVTGLWATEGYDLDIAPGGSR